jgi:hypothetical protein
VPDILIFPCHLSRPESIPFEFASLIDRGTYDIKTGKIPFKKWVKTVTSKLNEDLILQNK